jgi:chemotaxis protein methyltransferase CheR
MNMAKIPLSKEEFNLIRGFIEENCGISLGDNKEYLMDTRLSGLLNEHGCSSFKDLYLKAKNDPRSGLRDKIVDAMTTNETLWFRDTYPFDVLKSTLLPEFHAEIKSGKRRTVKIWSAACSSGQEPYSTAMTIMEFAKSAVGFKSEVFEILATDISPSVLLSASSGVYDEFATKRGLPKKYLNTYFVKKGRFWSVNSDIRKPIKFKQFNLQSNFIALGKFDVIFCRNVAIYFSGDFKKELFSKIAKALNPGGFMFLGGSESLVGLSDQFQIINHKGGNYYKIGK